MWFAHPGILWLAMGTALLPVLIHLINRRRYRREPWAATMFLLRAHRQSKRNIQVDHWLLLVLRTLVLIALGLAISRPYLSSGDSTWSITRPIIDRVIVLDDSLSMQARRENGETAFDVAMDAAEQIVSAGQLGDGAGLVTAAVPVAALVDRPLQDSSTLGSILDELRCSHGRSDWVAALRKANDVLGRGKASKGDRIVYMVTDLARASIPDSDIVVRLEEVDRVVIVDVGPASRGNVSVTALRMESPIVGPGIAARVRFRVTNHGVEPLDGLRVQISVDGRVSECVSVGALATGQSIEPKADVTFERAGGHVVTAELLECAGNVLAADDQANLAVNVIGKLPVLLVERETAAVSERSLFCLRVALNSRNLTEETVAVRTISPAELEGEILDEYRVVVIGDVPSLSRRVQERLRRYVRGGGGLIVAMGEQIDAGAYKELFFGGDVSNSLASAPSEMEPESAFFMNRCRIDSFVRIGETDEAVRFSVPTLRHALLSDFEGREDGGLRQAVVRGYWKIECGRDEDPPSSAQQPLSFTNGLPAILSERVGEGRVLVLTTGLSMMDTTLPAKPDFVPFVLNLATFAAGDESGRLNVETGDALVSKVKSQTAGDSLVEFGPDGSSHPVSVEAMEDSLAVVYRETGQPGVYRLRQGQNEQLFAVNVREGESDLRRADEKAVRGAFGAKATLVRDASEAAAMGERKMPRELASAGMYLLIALVIMETWAATSAGQRA